MEKEYGESIGYRSNAVDSAEHFTVDAANGIVTVYAERRNTMASLGEYGGDAYPVVWEYKRGNIKYGLILAADGVGQAAYTHPSLESHLEQNAKFGWQEKADDKSKLVYFLKTLYGDGIFDKSIEGNETLAYAMRCFSNVPQDGFFAAHEGYGQLEMPFYKRDSQSLGSRILCVGVYDKFRRFALREGILSWDKEHAEKLRSEIEEYIGEELAPKIAEMFSHDDAPTTDKRNTYFLSSTLAAWFYIYDERNKRISALALNCGDARCYYADGGDGVRQVSVDDAFDDGSMSAMIHFGQIQRSTGDYHDGKLCARIVNLVEPCALIACSDGVYDTCPGVAEKSGGKVVFPYGTEDANDFMFEINLLAALRRSYSLDDFAREIVFNFYAQSSTKGVMEWAQAGNFSHVKRDDSGTLGAKFFGAPPVKLFSVLRASKSQLDVLKEKVEKGSLPYYDPHIATGDEKSEELICDYATREFIDYAFALLEKKFTAARLAMTDAGEERLWGCEYAKFNIPLAAGGFTLKRNLKLKIVEIFKQVLKDFEECGENNPPPEDWKIYEHVLDKELYDLLKANGFEEWYKSIAASAVSAEDEKKRVQYEEFCKEFFGEPHKTGEIVQIEGVRSINLEEEVEAEPVREAAPATVEIAEEAEPQEKPLEIKEVPKEDTVNAAEGETDETE